MAAPVPRRPTTRFFPLAVVALLALLCSGTRGQRSCPNRCTCVPNGEADCSIKRLSAPPKAYPNTTRILNLQGNYIAVLGVRTFAPLPSLELLKLSNNRISSLRNDAFRAFPSLMTLDLDNNRIYRIFRRAFRRLLNLRTLSLSKNRIRSLARVFPNLPRLYQLNLGQNRIQSIGANDLSGMTRMHYLDLRDNKIARIDHRAFSNLEFLRYLYLNNNPLTVFPANMQFATQVLQLVDLSHCRLTRIPRALPASLSDLRLGSNQIAQIEHGDFNNITDLQMLALNDNDLQFVADNCMSHLSELQEVWFRSNQLVYIPRGLPISVKRLHMDQNRLTNVEAGIFPQGSHMEFINLEGNQISQLAPDTFPGLNFLTTINLQSNQLQELQRGSFRQLGSLSTILLSSNPLARISNNTFQNLGNLSQLFISHVEGETMQLEGNFLPAMLRLKILSLMNSPGLAQAFADVINNSDSTLVLREVTQIDLSYNTLTTLSPKFRRVFPGIRSLSLEGNPFRCSRSLRWLQQWIRSSGSEISFYTYEEPLCETPYRLQGRPLNTIGDREWAAEDEADGVRQAPPAGQAQPVVGLSGGPSASRRSVGAEARVGPRRDPNRRGGKEGKSRRRGGPQRKKWKGKGKGRGNKKSKKGGKGKGRNKKDKKQKRKKRDAFLNEDVRPVVQEVKAAAQA